MSALAAMKVIQQLCAAFCVYVASLGPFHRGAAYKFGCAGRRIEANEHAAYP